MATPTPAPTSRLGSLIFLSRWLQVPLYLGLIVAQVIYVWQFMLELWHIAEGVFGGHGLSEEEMMLGVLGLVDVVMIANLLIMVIVGGYETFVSRIRLDGHPDQPEWLSHVNANVLKTKLAMSIIGISSIHLLRSFIEARHDHLAPTAPTCCCGRRSSTWRLSSPPWHSPGSTRSRPSTRRSVVAARTSNLPGSPDAAVHRQRGRLRPARDPR